MSAPSPQLLASGGGPLGALSFGTIGGGSTSAAITLELWNGHGDSSAALLTEIRLEVYAHTTADSTFTQDGPESVGGYVEGQVTGIAAGGTGAPALQVTTWRKTGRGRPLRLDPLPGDSGRVVQFRLKLPVGALTTQWLFEVIVRWATPAAPIPEGLWSSGSRGVISGAGDGLSSYAILGGAINPSGTPDANIHIADTAWRFLGLPHVRLVAPLVFDQHDGAGATLAAGQAYWSTLSLGAGPDPTVTKGLAATAPAPVSSRPAVPTDEAFLAWVQVRQASGIASGDIDQTSFFPGGYALFGQVGLTAKLGSGQAVVGDTLTENDQPQALTFPASAADARVWLLEEGGLFVGAPPKPAARALELWRAVTSGSAITSVQDTRPWIGPDRQRTAFRFGAALAVAQTVYATLPGPEDRAISLPLAVLASCDPVASGSGSNVFDVAWWNGSAWVSLFTSSGTQDRRPTLPGAGPFVSAAALPEVLVLPGFSQIRVTVATISAPAPTGATLELLSEGA